MLLFETATRKDAVWISTRLREADRQEVAAATGEQPETAVPFSFDISQECWMIRPAVSASGSADPFAIFGTVAAGKVNGAKDVGIIWMLATDEIDNNAVAFARISRYWARRLLEPYDLTTNYVWNKNRKHLRWIRWAGFTILKPEKRGPFDEWFHPFYMIK